MSLVVKLSKLNTGAQVKKYNLLYSVLAVVNFFLLVLAIIFFNKVNSNFQNDRELIKEHFLNTKLKIERTEILILENKKIIEKFNVSLSETYKDVNYNFNTIKDYLKETQLKSDSVKRIELKTIGSQKDD